MLNGRGNERQADGRQFTIHHSAFTIRAMGMTFSFPSRVYPDRRHAQRSASVVRRARRSHSRRRCAAAPAARQGRADRSLRRACTRSESGRRPASGAAHHQRPCRHRAARRCGRRAPRSGRPSRCRSHGSCSGRDKIIGFSTHSLAQAEAAARAGVADYIGFGPIFPTSSKATSRPGAGPRRPARTCAAASPLPIVAIGGITAATMPDVLAAGADAVAMIGEIVRAADVGATVRTLLAGTR